MTKYAFLTEEWVEQARRLREEYQGRITTTGEPVRVNQVVTDVPFGSGTIDAHLESASGEIEIELGHLEDPDLTLTIDYATAKAVFVDGNPQAGMQAFMAGRIKVDGDMAKLIAMQGASPDAATLELAGRIKDMTE
ncbi:MAG: SCP2 sterol-binding domain-containing protein [Acidimicrobiales bacterium]